MTLDTRQKILLPITLGIFALAIWQGYSLLRPNWSVQKEYTSTATNPPELPPIKRVNLSLDTHPPTQHQPPGAPNILTDSQRQYLKLVNQYQLLKLKRLVVEEQAFIAAAEEKLSKYNHKAVTVDAIKDPKTKTIHINSTNPLALHYHLLYIDNQDGLWHATLENNGRYFEVTNGTLLPNHIVVTNIGDRGVTILRGTQRFVITFNGDIPLSGTKTQSTEKTARVIHQKSPHLALKNPPKTISKKSIATIKPHHRKNIVHTHKKPSHAPLAILPKPVKRFTSFNDDMTANQQATQAPPALNLQPERLAATVPVAI